MVGIPYDDLNGLAMGPIRHRFLRTQLQEKKRTDWAEG